jgi:beta-lactamase class D
MMRHVWPALLLASLSFSGAPIAAQDLSRFFKDTDSAFVLYDLKQNRYRRHNEARCRQRFSPCSTFKIPDSLIGLETKVLAEAEHRKQFYPGKLPVPAHVMVIGKDILVLEKSPRYTLCGKTGGGSLPGGKSPGWFVGYVEAQGNVYFFATNIEGANYAAIRDRRIELTKQILPEPGCQSH